MRRAREGTAFEHEVVPVVLPCNRVKVGRARRAWKLIGDLVPSSRSRCGGKNLKGIVKSRCQQSRIQSRLFSHSSLSEVRIWQRILHSPSLLSLLPSFTFFVSSQIAGCYVNVSQNSSRLAAIGFGCRYFLLLYFIEGHFAQLCYHFIQ